MMSDINRYAIISTKNKREIVLLRGRGCSWRHCRFCDYHWDYDPCDDLNYQLNEPQLNKVTGIYNKLEVVNSGSFTELDTMTMSKIETVAQRHNIDKLYFECHWLYRNSVAPLKARYADKGILVKVKTGVETFDAFYRETHLHKGISTEDPRDLARYFDECCLLQGLLGQTLESMLLDIHTALNHFERVCINIMQNNSSPIKADPAVIQRFMQEIYPLYKDDDRVDILLENTEFGVGGTTIHAQ